MQIKFKKLHDNAVLPSYTLEGDGAMDLTAVLKWTESDNLVCYDTGLAIELPEDHVALLLARSSISKKNMILANSVGLIDSNYRGPLIFKFYKAEESVTYEIGERVGQILVIPRPKFTAEWADELSSTNRGSGGFGSTGQ